MSAMRSAIVDEASDAVDIATSGLLSCAIVRSSGTYSLADLAEDDHPYAKRHGYPQLDPGTINAQTGAFRADWDARKIDHLHSQVTNSNPVAKYLVTEDGQGTRTMFHRGVDEAAQDDLVKRMPALEHVKPLPSV